MNSLSFLGRSGNLISVTLAGQGQPLVLLHGFPLDHRQWQAQLSGLAEHFRVIAPDLRGFGKSTLTEQAYSLADLADDVEQVRLHLVDAGPIALCGLSMGGYVAFEYWRRYSRNLSALVLTNTKPDADDATAKANRRTMIGEAERAGSWSVVSGLIGKQLTKHHVEQRGAIYHSVQQMMKECTVDGVRGALRAMAERADFTAALPSLTTPTLVIAGEEDPITPAAATRMWSAMLPNAACHVVAESAHLTPLEQPQHFNSLVREFLSSQ